MKYEPKLPPRAHQLEGLAKAQGREGFGWLMEMGTGKTKTDLDETGQLICSGDISSVLMFAPKGVYTNWQVEEIPKHWPDDLRAEVVFGTWEGGGTRAQRDMMDAMLTQDSRPRFLSVNLEAMGSSDRAVKFVQEYLRVHRRTKTSIDESTGIKNPTAVRTRMLDRHVGPYSMVRRILSGQPTPNGPMDMYSQMNWVLPGSLGKSFYSYRARYAVMQKQFYGSRAVDTIVDYRNLDELASRLEPHTFRKRKDECLDLPPKVYLPIRYVEMTDEQRRVYREVKENATALLSAGVDGEEDRYVTATMALTQLLRLHQVLCGHVTDEEGRVHLLETRRPAAMLEHCEEVGEQVVIWATYRQDIDRIEDALRRAWGPESVVSFHGGVGPADRELAKKRFTDGTAKFFVSNKTGARGITLVSASNALYYSNDHDMDTRTQSEDRIHRDGQLWPCAYQDLACRDTIEDRLIIPSLRRKITLASVLMRDPYQKWLV